MCISVDRSLEHGGFSSVNIVIVVTCHDNAKVIDTAVLVKFCKAFQVWENKSEQLNMNSESVPTNVRSIILDVQVQWCQLEL